MPSPRERKTYLSIHLGPEGRKSIGIQHFHKKKKEKGEKGIAIIRGGKGGLSCSGTKREGERVGESIFPPQIRGRGKKRVHIFLHPGQRRGKEECYNSSPEVPD